MTDLFSTRQVEKKSHPFSPTLPDGFIPRPDQLNPLKGLLTTPSKSNTLVITSKDGLGGMGKTSLALALTQDEMVRSVFPDGILWATLGPQPDLLIPLGQWLLALDDLGLKMPTITMASAQLQHLIKRRRMLLVVDEVWSVEDLKPFLVLEETHCRLVVTTRDVTVPDAQTYVLGEMTAPQAQQLFEAQLKQSLEQRNRKEALQFAKTVGYLPLSLYLGVSQIKNGLSWAELLAGVLPNPEPNAVAPSPESEEHHESTRPRRGLSLPIFQKIWNPSRVKDLQHQARQACLTFCIRQLSPELRLRLASLCLFPRNIDITPHMASTVWGLSLPEARKHLQDLKRLAFLIHGEIDAEQGQSYRLHPVMRDIARWIMELPTDSAMRGLGMTWATAQQQFLERYRPHLLGGQWHTIPEDGYIHTYVIWHLEQAGWRGEIHQLLQALNGAGQNAWYDTCDRIGLASNFTVDIARAWELAKSIYAEAPEYSTGLQVRYALTSAFVRETQRLAQTRGESTQNSGTPPESDRPTLPKVTESATFGSENWAFTKILTNAARYLPDMGTKVINSTLFPSVLDAQLKEQTIFELIKNVHQESTEMALELTENLIPNPASIDALIRLVPEHPSLSLSLWQLLQKSSDDKRLVNGVACLAQTGAHNLHQDLFPLLPKMQHPLDRLLILEQIKDRLPELLKQKSQSYKEDCLNEMTAGHQGLGHLPLTYGNILGALDPATEDFLDLYHHSGWAIALCFEQYPSRRLDEAFSQVIRSRSEEKRSKAMAFLVPRLLDQHREEIWALTKQLIDPECKARVLSRLHPFRPEALDHLLEIVKLFENQKKLKILLRSLPGPSVLIEQIFSTLLALSQPQHRWPVLMQLLPHLSTEHDEAVVAVIQESPFDAEGVCTLLKTLTSDQLTIAEGVLEQVEAIPPVYERAMALRQIMPYLPQALTPKALEIAQRIQFPYARVIALQPFIPGNKEVAQDAMESLINCHEQSPDDVYDALIPLLPEKEREALIALMTQLPDEVSRLQCMIRTLPYQPELIDPIKSLIFQNPDLASHCEMSNVLQEFRQICESDLSDANSQEPRTLELILSMLPLIEWVYSPEDPLNQEFSFCDLIQAFLHQTKTVSVNPQVISRLLDFFYLIPQEEKRAATLEQILQSQTEIEHITPELWMEWLEKLSRYQPAEFHWVFSSMVRFLMSFSNHNTLNQSLESIRSVREQWL